MVNEWACYGLIILFIFKVFRKPYIKVLDTFERGWDLFCLVPSLLMAMIYWLQYHPTPLRTRPENIPIVLLVYMLTCVIYLILYLNFESISQYYLLKQDRKLLAVQTEMHKKEYDNLLKYIETIKIYRHDMKHHLNAIASFLSDHNIDEAQRYIEKLDDTLSKTVLIQYCENYIINVILSSYIQKAENDGIKIRCEVNIPETVAIDPIEVGLIFANAIDNAIHACQRLDTQRNKMIDIACREHCGQLYIRISNPYMGVVRFEDDIPVSSSPEHGIGTKSIAAIAQKHGGLFSFSAQDGLFKTTVTLNFQ